MKREISCSHYTSFFFLGFFISSSLQIKMLHVAKRYIAKMGGVTCNLMLYCFQTQQSIPSLISVKTFDPNLNNFKYILNNTCIISLIQLQTSCFNGYAVI